jgi:hypothetical protein
LEQALAESCSTRVPKTKVERAKLVEITEGRKKVFMTENIRITSCHKTKKHHGVLAEIVRLPQRPRLSTSGLAENSGHRQAIEAGAASEKRGRRVVE